MQEFSENDYHAMSIIAAYLAYIAPTLSKSAAHYARLTDKAIHRHTFIWRDDINTVKKSMWGKVIFVPRYVDIIKQNNPKVASILFYGPTIFDLLVRSEFKRQSPIIYPIHRLIYGITKDEQKIKIIVNRLFKYFYNAVQSLEDAWNNYPNKPADFSKYKQTYIDFQDHIYLAETLFELYNPMEEQ